MEVLGHSHVAPTTNTRSEVAPEVSREAAERVAWALWAAVAQDDGDGMDGR